MDLLEVDNTQLLMDALYEYLDYQQHLEYFNHVEEKDKEHLKQQRSSFVTKWLKEWI